MKEKASTGADEANFPENGPLGITAGRRRIAALAGRLLARHWLSQHNTVSADSPVPTGEDAATSQGRIPPC